MPRSLGRDEERQYAVLVAELGALTEDIKAARSATTGIGLDLRAGHEPHARVHGERVRLPDGAEILVRRSSPATRTTSRSVCST